MKEYLTSSNNKLIHSAHKINILNFLPALIFGLGISLLTGCIQNQNEESKPHQLFAWVSQGDIMLFDSTSGSLRFITQGTDPSLSFDGRYLASSFEQAKVRRISITDLETGNSSLVNEIPGSCYRPEWSPSDHELIFLALTRQDGINFRVIVVFNPITKTKKAIQVEKTNLFSPVWSTDGHSILAHDTQHLYEWDREGNLINTINLEADFGPYLFSAYSTFRKNPEGDIWLFDAVEETRISGRVVQRNVLFLLSTITGKTEKISPDYFNVNGYCWGPDYSEILFSGQENGSSAMGQDNSSIFRINPDGSGFFLWKENAYQPTCNNFPSTFKIIP
ncbi:MAG: hypothetical protein K0B09_06080 [Bacteroidales bacterium]|nr:hypothetical protein [Bacteroidales bacterium]